MPLLLRVQELHQQGEDTYLPMSNRFLWLLDEREAVGVSILFDASLHV
jgi:hypothetical protein